GSGENGDSVVEMIGAGIEQRAIVNRPRARVGGDSEEQRAVRVGELGFPSVSLDGQGVRLPEVQPGVAEVSNLRRDGPGYGVRIEGPPVTDPGQGGEDAGQLEFRGEAKLEGDVGKRVAVVVDFDFVQNIWIKGEPGGAVGRLEEGIDTEDDGDLGNVAARA